MLRLIGAGGHAMVVADVARRAGHVNIAFFSDDERGSSRGAGGVAARPLRDLDSRHPIILAFGDLTRRRDIRSRYPVAASPIVDPNAVVGTGVTFGEGTVVMPGCIVNANATIGSDAILNTGCIVEHDCVIGDNSHLSPGVRLSGAATVGADVHIGTGAVVLPGIRVGDGAIIGAGAVVTRDVAARTTVVGVPARPLRG